MERIVPKIAADWKLQKYGNVKFP